MKNRREAGFARKFEPEGNKHKVKVKEMLASEPEGLDKKEKDLWAKMGPMTVEKFELYWEKVEALEKEKSAQMPLFDKSN